MKQISLDANTDCSSPEFLVGPIFKQLIGQEYSFSTAAIDNNDYKLTYELVSPLEPGNLDFSTPENISINNYNGLVNWDTEYEGNQIGEYLFAVRVTQYNNEGKRVGYIVRSFQVILEDQNAEIKITNSIADANGKIVVENDQKQDVRVLLESTSEESVWEAFFDSSINNNVSFSQYDSAIGPTKVRVGLLRLNSSSDIIRDNPYSITLRAKSMISTEVFSKDVSYLFFTKDIELPLITGVSESEQSGMLIYPNPFSDFIKVELHPINYPCVVDVLNSSGQIIIRAKAYNDEPLETSQLQPGFYILRIRNGLKNFSQKVIKK